MHALVSTSVRNDELASSRLDTLQEVSITCSCEQGLADLAPSPGRLALELGSRPFTIFRASAAGCIATIYQVLFVRCRLGNSTGEQAWHVFGLAETRSAKEDWAARRDAGKNAARLQDVHLLALCISLLGSLWAILDATKELGLALDPLRGRRQNLIYDEVQLVLRPRMLWNFHAAPRLQSVLLCPAKLFELLAV